MLLKNFLKATLIAGILCSAAIADNDIEVHGQITSIDNAKKTITLAAAQGNVVVQIFPYTKLKGDDCGTFGQDTHEKFTALKPNMFVKVEGYPQANSNVLGAKEVEWKCGKSAY